MMKKKWLILISIMVLAIAGVIWFNNGSEPPIVVEGNLTAKDIADIKRVVLKGARRQVFPDFSWKSIKEFPANFKFYTQFRIKIIAYNANDDTLMNNKAWVYYQYGRGSVHEDGFFQVIKGTHGWSVSYSWRMPGTLIDRSSTPQSPN